MKKIIITIALLGIIEQGWYLLSPLFINTTVNEDLPITSSYSEEEARAIVDTSDISEEETITQTEVNLLEYENPYQDIINSGIVAETIVEPKLEETIIEEDTIMNEPMVAMKEAASIETRGIFSSRNNYSGEGQVKLITDGESQILRFEDFSVTNGPDFL